MGKRNTKRKLAVYIANAHRKGGAVDYLEFLNAALSLPVSHRRIEETDSVLLLEEAPSHAHLVGLKVYEGDPDQLPLIVDKKTGKSRMGDLDEDDFVGQTTHALFNPANREMIVEYNHRGAKAKDIAKILTHLLKIKTSDSAARFELTAIADEEFLEAVSSLKRIRVAEVKLAEPNVDWTDNYDSLSKVGDASDAKAIKVTAFAHRQQSLSKKRGLVQLIKNAVTSRQYPVENAVIKGIREGDDNETTISMQRFIEHRWVRLGLTEAGHISDRDIAAFMIEYAQDREKK